MKLNVTVVYPVEIEIEVNEYFRGEELRRTVFIYAAQIMQNNTIKPLITYSSHENIISCD